MGKTYKLETPFFDGGKVVETVPILPLTFGACMSYDRSQGDERFEAVLHMVALATGLSRSAVEKMRLPDILGVLRAINESLDAPDEDVELTHSQTLPSLAVH